MTRPKNMKCKFCFYAKQIIRHTVMRERLYVGQNCFYDPAVVKKEDGDFCHGFKVDVDKFEKKTELVTMNGRVVCYHCGGTGLMLLHEDKEYVDCVCMKNEGKQ